jgi:hypothetical protein
MLQRNFYSLNKIEIKNLNIGENSSLNPIPPSQPSPTGEGANLPALRDKKEG